MKKLLSLFLAALLLLSLTTAAFAQRIESLDNSAIKSSSRIMAGEIYEPRIYSINALQSSAEDHPVVISVGDEETVLIFPFPEEAQDQFDIQKATVSCSKDGVVDVLPKQSNTPDWEQITVKGVRQGYTVVTITDPGGASCRFGVIVLPKPFAFLDRFFERILTVFVLIGTPFFNS